MPGSPVVFYILAVVAVATAAGMLLSRNAVYSALFLALNFGTVAMLYLILGAPFIALSQITVYAGSIMVLFLFVIMLLGAENLPISSDLPWQPWVAVPVALILAGDFAINLMQRSGELAQAVAPQAGFGSPAAIGDTLFTQYMLPFEVTAVILLAATVGSIILAKPERLSAGQRARQGRARTNAPRNVDSVTGLEMPSLGVSADDANGQPSAQLAAEATPLKEPVSDR